eukprot:COSAG02_NODE_18078_length_952_cov_1.535342_1_plen_29_part_10
MRGAHASDSFDLCIEIGHFEFRMFRISHV